MPTLQKPANAESLSADDILNLFLEYLLEIGVELYDHQEEAILEIFEGKNVILNTPTGSGKSMVALAMHFKGLCQGRKSYYTVPIKALANEKFLSLCKVFGPDNVGMITGDATVNPKAPVICCTAEILANVALREGGKAHVDDVIMDEFHYYSDLDRGWAWQAPLLTLPQSRFLLMSATIGDTQFFQDEIEQLTQAEVALVQSDQRPVPLEFDYSETVLQEKVVELVEANKAPVYLVHFTQRSCAESAQNLMSSNVCTKEEKKEIAEALKDANFRSPYGKEVSKLLRHGIGIHHAGLLPKYRILVEKLTQRGLLKVICGTDTLGVGVNVPIRSVLFTQLCKFDGSGTKILTVRDFKQIAGRAGRRGFDDVGYVVAQAPEHVIENIRAEEKAAASTKKRKVVKKKPPERGFVSWNEATFRKLIDAAPEPLVSRFITRHNILLNVLSREGEDGCGELKRIIESCHENDNRKAKLKKQSFALFRGLVQGGVLEIIPPAERTSLTKVKLHVDMQEDFTMNQALGLYLIDSIPLLDREAPDYSLNVLSLVEAILENPNMVLMAQENKLKRELINELKEDGVSYDDRMEQLEEVEWPKPGKDFIYNTFNDFIAKHPWVDAENIRPKSIAREMYENYQNFEDYIKEYGLERSEAVLLRHLSEVYKVLDQTVPPASFTEELDEAKEFLEEILRGVDSSLLDEWELLKNPERVVEESAASHPAKKQPYTRRKKEFQRALRHSAFSLVKELAHDRLSQLIEMIEPADEDGELWTVARLDPLMDEYFDQHDMMRLDPEARNAKHFYLDTESQPGKYLVEQVIVDGQGNNDWLIKLSVDLAKSDAEERPVVQLRSFGPIVG
ncbi:DEAD/DEAH box helicase [Persicirhabdus sediminis]|uniref:DUF3516 domain-containing protein n=1 Tax=Persicirhabdus sediminis TaxID=454144 RepID=A0A8J7ME98_9BACT|nr:DUF3516 domain-containing protein [Persicirhabdus sediminis]MBK1791676.1 DUF3516 domain-containing protein [Persicirhabdus sediminis]